MNEFRNPMSQAQTTERFNTLKPSSTGLKLKCDLFFRPNYLKFNL